MQTVEIRCPIGPKRLLAKALFTGEAVHRTDGNLLEFSCDDCKRSLRKQGRSVTRVLHRYNVLGELVESVVI